MSTILETMSHDHRQCDDLFALVEQAVLAENWRVADKAFQQFSEAVLGHFSAEEVLLFPAFEARTGMSMGPTQVMRSEHAQMREMLDNLSDELAARDADAYTGDSETLLIMIQQHNMKEENILYPMCDQHLEDSAHEIASRLLQLIETKSASTSMSNDNKLSAGAA